MYGAKALYTIAFRRAVRLSAGTITRIPTAPNTFMFRAIKAVGTLTIVPITIYQCANIINTFIPKTVLLPTPIIRIALVCTYLTHTTPIRRPRASIPSKAIRIFSAFLAFLIPTTPKRRAMLF